MHTELSNIQCASTCTAYRRPETNFQIRGTELQYLRWWSCEGDVRSETVIRGPFSSSGDENEMAIIRNIIAKRTGEAVQKTD